MSENYLGNPNLFKAHTKQEYTEQQIVEIDKCMNDPVYFIKKYVLCMLSLPSGTINCKWKYHYTYDR